MKNSYQSILLFVSLLAVSCSFPEDRKDNPNNEPVVHTGNATDSFDVNSPSASAVLTSSDSARMVFNDDSSVSGTPSGRGTETKGSAVSTGSSRPGENYPNPNHSNDSAYRK